MELEKRMLRDSTVEGYRVLLRAEADLLLPCDRERIRAFYLALAKKCIAWVTEVTGERVRARYLKLPTTAQKARFGTCTYRFRMRSVATEERHAVFLCESELIGVEETVRYRRLSHVWCTSEETILPHSQILRLYSPKRAFRGLGFHPDGIYPEGGELVFFKNATKDRVFEEKRYPIDVDGNL